MKSLLKRKYNELYGNNDVYDRLKQCSYTMNYNNYIFLCPPFENKEFPCDYKIANLIKFLWSHKIITAGSNQPNDEKNEYGYITFLNITSNKKEVVGVLQKIWGEENMNIFNKNVLRVKIEDDDYSEKLNKQRNKILSKNKKKINIEITTEENTHNVMFFSEQGLNRIYKIIGLTSKQKNVIPGFLSCTN